MSFFRIFAVRGRLLYILVWLSFLMAVLVILGENGNGEKAQAQGTDSRKASQDQDEIVRWQYQPVNSDLEIVSGFDGLSFTGGSILDPEAAFFCLTEDSESSVMYGYVPAEMTKALHVRMHEGERLVITEGVSDSDGSADSAGSDADGSAGNSDGKDSSGFENGNIFFSGDELPVFEGGKHYTFSILDGDGQSLGEKDVVFLYTENVPSMYVETQSGSIAAVDADKKHNTSEAASYRIFLTSGMPDSGGLCSIKGRGNSTWSQEKRPYNLNLENRNILLGMESCKKYALIANFWDSTQTRQYFAYLAAKRLGLEYTPQTQFVNLYINGRYQSLYLLTQRLNVNGGTVAITNLDKANKKANEKQLMRIAEEKAEEAEAAEESQAADGSKASAGGAQDTAGGAQAADGEKASADGAQDTAGGEKASAGGAQTADSQKASAKDAQKISTDGVLPESVVMESDGKGNEGHAYAWEKDPENISGGYLLEFQDRYKKEDVWFSTDTMHISFKEPETPSVGEYEYISGYVREAEKALFSDDWTNKETGLSCFDYFDLDSWARMYLIQDFFVQSDDEYYSFYFYKKTDDPRLYCGPVWDFDLCLGNMNCGDYYLTSAQTLWLKDGRKRWLHRMGKHPEFKELIAKLYLEEFEPIVRKMLDEEYDEMVSYLETDTNLNYLRWHKSHLNYRDRTGRVRTLIETRADFLHDYYSDPSQFHRLLFSFAWGDFSYYVKDGESMGFLPTADYGEKQSTPQRESNGFITGWIDTKDGTLLTPDEPISKDRTFDPQYE